MRWNLARWWDILTLVLALTATSRLYGEDDEAAPEGQITPVAESLPPSESMPNLGTPDARDAESNRYYVQADALFLNWRSRMASQPVVLDTPGNVLLTTRDADLRSAAGLRLAVGYCPDSSTAWEFLYFGLPHWHDQQQVDGDNNLRIPGDLGLATYDFLFANHMRVDYEAEMHNIELNRWWRTERLSWLVGLRYVSLDESFNIHGSDSDTGGSDYHVRSWNHLLGGQVGARLARQFGRLGFDLTGKIGVFANMAGQGTFVGDFDNSYIFRDLKSEATRGAMVADLVFSANYQVTDRLWLRGGYNLMWLEQIALAPLQLDFTDTPASGAAVNTRGGAFLQGAHAGFEFRW